MTRDRKKLDHERRGFNPQPAHSTQREQVGPLPTDNDQKKLKDEKTKAASKKRS